MNRESDCNLLKGLAAGLVAGLVATWVKDRFQRNLGAAMSAFSPPPEPSRSAPSEESSTAKTAERISEGLFAHKLTDKEKEFASPAVDYVMGTLSGGFYGALAEVMPELAVGNGLGFGFGLWLFADEIAVPALGLSKPAKEYPVAVHAVGLSGHLVYGLTAELVRGVLRRD